MSEEEDAAPQDKVFDLKKRKPIKFMSAYFILSFLIGAISRFFCRAW